MSSGWTIGKRLYSGIGVLVALLLGSTAVHWYVARLQRSDLDQPGLTLGRVDARNTAVTLIDVALLVISAGTGAAMALSVRGINGSLRRTSSGLKAGAHQVLSAATQIAGASQGLSQGATEQAASLEETSASMEEMASMTRQNAENSHQAAGLMGEVDRRVNESNQALASMVESMNAIQDSSAKVGRIIKTIDEIAFQTNILALNAAVEAARAGDAGMGFAVVADEVRSLAQRSAQAAKDTESLIEEAGSNAQQGHARVKQVAETVAAITASVTRVKRLVDEVSVASRQQAQGIDQVTQAVAQMEKSTQTAAATAEESAAASEELSAQAESALMLVHQLEAIVDGRRQSNRPGAIRTLPRPSQTVAAPSYTASWQGRGRRRTAEDEIPLETGTYGRF